MVAVVALCPTARENELLTVTDAVYTPTRLLTIDVAAEPAAAIKKVYAFDVPATCPDMR